MISLEVYEGEGNRIAEGMRSGQLMQRGRITVEALPPHRKGEVEIVVRLTVARSDQIGVHVDVYHNKEKIREIDDDLHRDVSAS